MMDGPPDLSDEELEKIDTEAETQEVTRLLQMRVLIPEDENTRSTRATESSPPNTSRIGASGRTTGRGGAG